MLTLRKIIVAILVVIVMSIIAAVLVITGVFLPSYSTVSAREEMYVHTVTYDDFTFEYPTTLAPHVNIITYDVAPDDVFPPLPAHTMLALYQELPAPQSALESTAAIYVFDVADMDGMSENLTVVDNLRTLLDTRPDLTMYETTNGNNGTAQDALPYLPLYAAGQAIRARAQYIDTDAFSGIAYVTVYRQDVSPFVNTELTMTYQLLSNDGSTYVSVIVPLISDFLPDAIPADFDHEAFYAEFDAYNAETTQAANDAAVQDFTPNLGDLDVLVRSFALGS